MKLSMFTYSQILSELKQVMQWRGTPKVLRCDNGPEYNSVNQSWPGQRDEVSG